MNGFFEAINFDQFKAGRARALKHNENEVTISTSTAVKNLTFSSAFSRELEKKGMKYIVIGRMADSYEVIFKFCKSYEASAILLARHSHHGKELNYFTITGKYLVPEIKNVLGIKADFAKFKLAADTSRTEEYVVRRVVIEQ